MPIVLIGIGLLLFAGGYMAVDYYQKLVDAKTAKEKYTVFDSLFQKYAKVYQIPDWRWLKAIAKQESDLGQDSRVKNRQVSYDGLSYGLMQIAEGKGSQKEIELKGNGGQARLDDPEYSIDRAARLVSYLWKKYNDRYKVFLAYNQGENNTDKGKDYTVNYSADKVPYPKKIEKWLEWINVKDKEYGIVK